ncbi:MAG: heme exporter protein CcmD [Azospirillaceae bacterium]
MSEFFAMGGYAPYVWGAYGLALVLIVALAVVSWRRLRAAEKTLKTLEAVRGRRRERRGDDA